MMRKPLSKKGFNHFSQSSSVCMLFSLLTTSGAVQGIADLIIRPGMINVDFADVKTVMGEIGMAMMGSADASGENRAREAAEEEVRNL